MALFFFVLASMVFLCVAFFAALHLGEVFWTFDWENIFLIGVQVAKALFFFSELLLFVNVITHIQNTEDQRILLWKLFLNSIVKVVLTVSKTTIG